MFLHVTLADLMVTVFSVAGQLVWEVLDRKWLGGFIFCKIFKFLQTYSLTTSNYMILALALERFRAVTKPLSLLTSPHSLILSAWTCALLPSLPNLVIFTRRVTEDREECSSDFTDWDTLLKKGYFTTVFLAIFVIPLVRRTGQAWRR